jgi:hypothetical protein
LKAPPAEELPARVKCPGCGSKFELNPDGSVQPIALATPPGKAVAVPPATDPCATEPNSLDFGREPASLTHVDIAPEAAATGSVNVPMLVGMLAGGVVVLCAGIVLAVVLISSGNGDKGEKDTLVEKDKEKGLSGKNAKTSPEAPRHKEEPRPVSNDKAEEKKPEVRAPAVVKKPMIEINPIVRADEPMPPKNEEGPKPAVPSPFKPLPAEDQKKVHEAIDKGIVFLKACLDDKGTAGRDKVFTAIGPVSIEHLGATALAGLTLLACGVPAEDPAVKKVIARVRNEGPREASTYVLSLLILFLDQLGDSRDRDLIQSLAVRLIAGQTIRGGWPYACPQVSSADQKKLLKLLDDKVALNRAESVESNRLRDRYRGVAVLSYKVGDPVSTTMPISQVFDFNPGYDDNSTTQFAILALWAAQKTGVPVDKSLAMADMRFRALQNGDGSWGYNKMHANLWCDSMTCAALMGLAAGRGVAKLETDGQDPKARALSNDPQVKRGLAFLGRAVGKPGIKRSAPPTAAGRNNRLFGSTAEEDIFFLWSMERMSVIYSLEKIDGKEWYPWAAKLLVDAQRTDGSWIELYGSAPNTCFALLVLKRVNVVKDLTSRLQKLELTTIK